MKIYTPLVLVVSLLLSACSTTAPVVDHSFNPNYDISAYKTFKVLPVPHPEWDEGAKAIIGKDQIPLVVARSVLESKGFEYVENVAVDFFVGIRAEIHVSKKPESEHLLDKMEEGQISYAPNLSGESLVFAWEPSIRGSMNHGGVQGEMIESNRAIDHSNRIGGSGNSLTMWVEVFDVKSSEIVWKGSATASSPEAFRGDAKRTEIVQKILAQFPN